MDVKVNVRGVEATVTVESAAQVAELLREIAQDYGSPAEKIQPEDDDVEDTDEDYSESVNEEELEDLVAALRPMCGSTAARAMVALSQTTESLMSDVQLRHMLEIDPEANLGPVFAAISRGVKQWPGPRRRLGTTNEARHSRKASLLVWVNAAGDGCCGGNWQL